MQPIPTRRFYGAGTVLVATAGLALSGLAPAAGAIAPTHRGHPSAPTTVASGLDNPRHLSFGSDGSLYIAESGKGGAGPCANGPEGRACLGTTGAITVVRHGSQWRVVTGLPSLAGPDGSRATGPADVAVSGRGRIAIAIGLGGSPAKRTSLGAAAGQLGTVLSGNLAHRTARLSVVADVAGYEAATDADGAGVDSNPSSLIRTGNRYVVTDSGGNTLVKVGKHGSSTVAVFPSRLGATPPGSGMPPMIPMQAVPTGVDIGPDGAYYVSQLTGFPFPVGGSIIWRVVPGETPTAYASGLTNVTDLTWSKGRLFAVQLATGGLLSAQGLPMGSLVEVTPGAATHRVIAANLPAPYGVAVRHGDAYVTTCSVCAGGGSVLRIPIG